MRNLRLLSSNALAGAGILAIGLALTGCETETSTELNPAGPPMILQVFANEVVTPSADNPSGESHQAQLLFGDHPDIDEAADDRTFVTATSGAGAPQQFQIVFDELLLGNNLEEIACADGSFDRVPPGSTPDDIAACSGPGEDAPAGCTAVCVENGGILDVMGQANEPDGAADDFRFIEGIVTITCDGMEMPIDIDGAFYNPSGNQLISALSGVDSLGPAIFISPLEGLRANSECVIEFADTVVGKDGTQVCAPAGGNIDSGCSPGDTTLLTFKSEILKTRDTTPDDGATDVPFGDRVRVAFTLPPTPESVNAVTVTTGGTEVPASVAIINDVEFLISLEGQTGFDPETEYTITITGAGVTDSFGAAMEEDVSFSFTTGSDSTPPPDAGMMPDAAMPDAAMPDAMPAPRRPY